MASKAQRGKQAQRQGAAFERRIEDDARRYGIILHKVPAPVQILRVDARNPRLRIARLEAATAPDWLGSYDGRSVALEAKTSTHPTRWSLGDRLCGHQGDALKAVAEDGGIAAVLVCRLFDGGSTLYLLPWPDADPRPARKSWRWEQMAQWQVTKSWTEDLVRQ